MQRAHFFLLFVFGFVLFFIVILFDFLLWTFLRHLPSVVFSGNRKQILASTSLISAIAAKACLLRH